MAGPGPDGRSVAIIGGGIGGLAAAIGFARSGARVTVYEQAPAIREVGAGIQITPNGARVLDALGLGEVAERRGLRAEAVEPMDGLRGDAVTRIDLTGLSGPPYRFFHRATLIDMLARAARSEGVTLRMGERITDVAADGSFTAKAGRVEPDLLVGADGVRSVVRPVLDGPSKPFFTNQVAWRAVVSEVEAPPVARIWMAPGQHVVTYPLPGRKMNLVAVQERRDWTEEGWNRPADPSVMRHAFAAFTGRVTGLMNRVDSVMEWGLHRHPVAQVWARGPVAMLGDAAHPTLPFLAQGANLALEDAYVLVGLWRRGETGLYTGRRVGRVTRAIEAANANAKNYHLSGAMRFAAHSVLRGIGAFAPRTYTARLAWLYEHDVTKDG